MILDARGVRMSFGDRVVIDGFDLAVDRGEQCALTGRSGSGKTTLLLLLAGLLRPTAGVVDLRLRADQVVYVPQAPSLLPELTAVQNASIGLRVRGTDPGEAEARARTRLHALGLRGVDDALPGELSGGMQQRVALARALAVEPLLLLVDEPTGALDQSTGAHVIDVLVDQATQTSAAIVVATHDHAVAARFARLVVVERELVR